MKIVVVRTSTPFVTDRFANATGMLVQALNENGHAAEMVRLPFSADTMSSVLNGMVAAAMTRLRGIDRTILVDFPSYYVKHENRVVWLYDAVETTKLDPVVNRAIANMDRIHLGGIRVRAASPSAQRTFKDRSGIVAPLLAVPAPGDAEGWATVAQELAS